MILQDPQKTIFLAIVYPHIIEISHYRENNIYSVNASFFHATSCYGTKIHLRAHSFYLFVQKSMRPKLVRFIVDGFLVISGNDLGVHYSSSML